MLGNGNNNTEEKTFINLVLRATPGETTDKPVFVKLGDDFKETNETFNEVSGKLISIKSTYTEAKGKRSEIFGFKAFLEDGDEMYIISTTLTNASKDLLNALLVNKGKQLKITLYLNKHGYPTSSVKLSDGNWAQTALEYNKIDRTELFNLIKKQEEITNNKDEIKPEDIPF